MKKKFVLEFDEEPALIFVQNMSGSVVGDAKLYQDGELVNGWRSVEINAGVDDSTTHKIEFATGFTDESPMKNNLNITVGKNEMTGKELDELVAKISARMKKEQRRS